MISLVYLALSIALAVYIKRKGLTTVELRELLTKQGRRIRATFVNFKIYRWTSGHVWLNLEREGWVHARWCKNAKDGYLVRFDSPGGMTHKKYNGILNLEDYTRR